ncbi:MAG: radical SAM protein [Methanospirillaceae archaeon]|nr:radical SAM protein [Methanospirillaceae archaeon]
MKILFLNIYPQNTMARYLLSSYLLKGYLSQSSNHETKILNFPDALKPDQIITEIKKLAPDIISYSCYVWNISLIDQIFETLTSLAESELIHIFGGPEITIERLSNLNCSQENVFYIIGEGEEKFSNLIISIEKGDIILPPGVAYLKDGNIEYESNLTTIKDLDIIPSIYVNNIIEDRLYAYQQAFIETQRGCKYRCKYCVYHKNIRQISYYSIERVLQELDFLICEKKITALRIFDAIFTSDLSRAKKIVKHLHKLKTRGHHIPWIYWEYTYDSVDNEFLYLVSLLKDREKISNSSNLLPKDRAQLYSDMLQDYIAINCIGLQSFNPEALRNVGRPKTDWSRFCSFMHEINKNNLVIKLDIILGLPGETYLSFMTGLDKIIPFFKDTDHILNIHRLQVLPGSDLEKLKCKFNLSYSSGSPHFILSTSSMTKEEMILACKLSGLLFRIINSPLRDRFYKSWEKSDLSLERYLKKFYVQIETDSRLESTEFIQNLWVDDEYWNGKVFSEIPSQYLIEYMDINKEFSY